MNALVIENLFLKVTKEYYALYNINLTVKQGEKILIIGQKGSGRTPLLRCLCGLEKSYQGNIFLNGHDLNGYDFSGNYQVGFLPSYPVFFDTKTVRYNLQYVLKNRKVDKTLIETKVNDTLTDFGLNRIADNLIYQLTEYEKFLVAVARLSLRKLDLLIIDSFEDRFNQEEISMLNTYVVQLITPETTVLKATDQYSSIYKDFAIYYMKAGSLIANSTR